MANQLLRPGCSSSPPHRSAPPRRPVPEPAPSPQPALPPALGPGTVARASAAAPDSWPRSGKAPQAPELSDPASPDDPADSTHHTALPLPTGHVPEVPAKASSLKWKAGALPLVPGFLCNAPASAVLFCLPGRRLTVAMGLVSAWGAVCQSPGAGEVFRWGRENGPPAESCSSAAPSCRVAGPQRRKELGETLVEYLPVLSDLQSTYVRYLF